MSLLDNVPELKKKNSDLIKFWKIFMSILYTKDIWKKSPFNINLTRFKIWTELGDYHVTVVWELTFSK